MIITFPIYGQIQWGLKHWPTKETSPKDLKVLKAQNLCGAQVASPIGKHNDSNSSARVLVQQPRDFRDAKHVLGWADNASTRHVHIDHHLLRVAAPKSAVQTTEGGIHPCIHGSNLEVMLPVRSGSPWKCFPLILLRKSFSHDMSRDYSVPRGGHVRSDNVKISKNDCGPSNRHLHLLICASSERCSKSEPFLPWSHSPSPRLGYASSGVDGTVACITRHRIMNSWTYSIFLGTGPILTTAKFESS